MITFVADRVKVKSGHRVDNSGEVILMVGEYELDKIKELVGVVDQLIKVSIEIDEQS